MIFAIASLIFSGFLCSQLNIAFWGFDALVALIIFAINIQLLELFNVMEPIGV